MELVLEQTQQGTSYEVSVSTKGVEELKRKVKIHGEKKEALLTLRQKPEYQSDTKVTIMTMEILLEPTSNKLLIEHAEYDESNTYVLERFNTTAGNPVKENLLKLNLPDHRIYKDGHGGSKIGDVDINTLAMEQYLALARGNQALGVVKPKIEGNVSFEINSQFMRELREYTFLGNKNDDAYEHVERIFDISYKEMGRQTISKNNQHLGFAQEGLHSKDAKTMEELTLTRNVLFIKRSKVLRKSNMEKSAKKEAEHDEWLRKFQESTKINQKGYDEIIRNLESKVKALTGEVEGRASRTKIGECKAISTKEELPMYTPFYYSPEEIDFFPANSSFLDEEETEEVEEIEEVEAQHEPTHQNVTPNNLLVVSCYVAPYEPPILFPIRVEQHAEEALVHKVMESLKRLKVNCLLLKEIRQTDDYAKHMKNLVVNKLRTSKNEDVKMNTRCSTILQNQLPPKEHDPGNMVEDLRMPIILGRPLLVTTHAKVDIFKQSVSLEVGNQKVVFKTKKNHNKTLIKPVCAIRNEKSVTNGDLMKESQDEINYKCTKLDQGKPWEIEASGEPNRERDIDLSSITKLKEHWCKAIIQQKGDWHEFWASCNPYDDQCDGGDLPENIEEKCYWCCLNGDKRLDVTWEGMSFKEWRQELNQDDMVDINPNVDLAQETNTSIEEDCEDLEDFGKEKMELILDTVLDKLDDR
ncbi:hypothetical protein Tco_0502100 [Tanacetum coccineum]